MKLKLGEDAKPESYKIRVGEEVEECSKVEGWRDRISKQSVRLKNSTPLTNRVRERNEKLVLTNPTKITQGAKTKIVPKIAKGNLTSFIFSLNVHVISGIFLNLSTSQAAGKVSSAG